MAHILLVEDDPDNAELVVYICESLGHTVRVAENGVEALRLLLEKEQFDLALVDVLMPQMDGIDLTMTLRRSPRHQHLPIVGVTAIGGARDTTKLIAAGMDAVVTKPYTAGTLREAIAAALEGR